MTPGLPLKATDYTRYFGARTYTVKRYFGRKEATFCGRVIQNVIVSTEAIFAIDNLLPRRRAIPALSNNTKSADLPASRSDKQWNTWYRYVHDMIQVLAIEVTVQYGFRVVSFVYLLVHCASY